MTYEYHDQKLSAEDLKGFSPDEQIEVMEAWFRSRFEDPAENTPYDSSEGGYLWMTGGPHDALEELEAEFDGTVPANVIRRLSESLSNDCPEWAPVISWDDYDFGLFDAVASNIETLATFRQATETIRELLKIPVGPEQKPHLLRLLFANAIGAFETFLCDTFINRILENDVELRRFIETTPAFKERKIPYAAVLREAENVRENAKRVLLDMVWHRLKRVSDLYGNSLLVQIDGALSALEQSVQIRHDIVHRNGKDKDGNPVEIKDIDVEAVLKSTDKVAAEIERQLGEIDDTDLDTDEV